MGRKSINEAQTCRQYLERYRELCEAIDATEGRINALRDSMGSVSSPRFDGMPRGGGDNTSKVERLVLRLQGQEEELGRLREQENDLYWALDDIIKKIKNPKWEAIICMRYLDGMKWSKIVAAIYEKELDEEFVDEDAAIERFTKRTFKDHGFALLRLEEIWPDEWEGEELEAYD